MLSFIEARRRIESKDKGLREKVVNLEEAVKLISNGDTVFIGGCYYSRTPMATIREIIRQGKRDLTIIRGLTCYEASLLFVSGAVKKLITSWYGIGAPPHTSKVMRKYIEEKRTELEEWSHLGIALRLHGGMMGVPYLPMLSMLGSDLMKQCDAKEVLCPFTNEKLCLVPSVFPDVAIIHAQRADPYGNAQIFGLPYFDKDAALASGKVIITCEELVSRNTMRRTWQRATIPFFCVDAVAEVPFGCFPHECQGYYESGFEHFEEYDTFEEKGEDGVREYLKKYIYEPATFGGYLDLFPTNLLTESVKRMENIYGKQRAKVHKK